MSISVYEACLINDTSTSTSASTNCLDQDSPTRKRKREHGAQIELDNRPFAVKSSLSDPYSKPNIFTPLHLLSRSQLPLSYLDTSPLGPRLFQAQIKALESLEDAESASNVLIAKSEEKGTLCAIERVQWRTYAICQLGSWVSEIELRSRAGVQVEVTPIRNKRCALQAVQGNSRPWWNGAAVERASHSATSTAASTNASRFAMLRRPLDSSDRLPALPESPEASPARPSGHEDITSDVTIAPVTPADGLQELAKHYLEALYTSRTSLAYFTKGPLSRARATFNGTVRSELGVAGLIDFLRGTILSSSTMDKKYKDSISETVTDLPVTAFNTPEQPMKARKKRKWKGKRDKSGFFVDEKDYVSKWWVAVLDEEGTSNSTESIEATLNRRTPRLRSRETYMQIVLVLEVLALEASMSREEHGAPSRASVARDTQLIQTQAEESQAVPKAKKQSSRKPQDLLPLLEILLDKLCIWHSLGAHSPTKGKDDVTGVQQKESNDELKNFCIEVVVPFYLARLPSQATMVNKKLGGPSAPSPVKRRTDSSRKAAGERTHPAGPQKKPREPLHRVFSNTVEARVAKPPPALHRSATDSQLVTQPHIKREDSQTPSLHSIPSSLAQVQTRKRPSLMQTLAKREVDLSAMSQASEIKMRKKAEVEEKLREAISTLKKPNRTLATKDVACATDQSFAKATERKRPGQPIRRERPGIVRSNEGDGVHVTATPSHRRAVKATPHKRPASNRDHYFPSSATTHVPSSSSKGFAHPGLLGTEVPGTGHRPRHFNMNASSRFAQPTIEYQPSSLESPVASRRPIAVEATPSKPVRPMQPLATTSLKQPSDHLAIPGSTSKATMAYAPIETSPVVTRKTNVDTSGGGKPQRSVYEVLGWTDDYDELA